MGTWILCLPVGCVVHEARISAPPAPPAPVHADQPGPTTVVIGSAVRPASAEPVVFRGPLPQDVCVSVIRRDEDGTLYRAERHVVTPLPWWQRFPCDMVVDLAPFDATARTEVVITPEPVPAVDEQALLESARCDGYVTPKAERRP